MLKNLLRHGRLANTAPRAAALPGRLFATTQDYGRYVFKGKAAESFLEGQGLPKDVMDSPAWTRGAGKEKIAAAVLEWAKSCGASSFCHWFQPLGSSVLRHGLTGQVQNRMIEFDGQTGEPIWKFTAKNLMFGETDGSSYNTGGLRETHRAGGYTCIDPTSPIFFRGDTMFIPACFVSFMGEALDEKTPLLRALDALSNHGSALLDRLGYISSAEAGSKVGVEPHIGLEQEFFVVPRDAYLRRVDLQLSGRSVLGRLPPRGQEAADHYMAPISEASPAAAFILEVQEECYRLGIPLKTRHREVAPNQYEVVAMFGHVTRQVDINIILAQILEEVAVRHNLAALLHEKPFNGINGSGKHNNWSLRTTDGTNLFNFSEMQKVTGSSVAFAVVMAALVKAIDVYGGLVRLSCTCPGNEFRLGACEAPPAIMSVYLGSELTKFLEDFKSASDVGSVAPFKEGFKQVDLGASVLSKMSIPAQDRNRTSPFPFITDRFEFRALGSSQNPALANTVLAAIMAQSFKDFVSQIDSGMSPAEVAQDALKKHWRVVFNGDSYDQENQQRLIKSGVSNISSTVEALHQFGDKENMRLFEEMNILNRRECLARHTVAINNYIHMIEIEANCMVDMIVKDIIPALHRAMGDRAPEHSEKLKTVLHSLEIGCTAIQKNIDAMHAELNQEKKAVLCQRLRLDVMTEVRGLCDQAESLCPSDLWPFSTYQELLFLDQGHHTSQNAQY